MISGFYETFLHYCVSERYSGFPETLLHYITVCEGFLKHSCIIYITVCEGFLKLALYYCVCVCVFVGDLQDFVKHSCITVNTGHCVSAQGS